MFSFSIFNIPVRVQPFFWLTLIIISGGFRAGGDSKEDLIRIALFVLAGFISILVHELGHALTAKHFGKRVEIVLQAFGGYAAYSGGAALSRARSAMITAAGPGLQIILGIAAFALLRSSPEMSPMIGYFMSQLVFISIFWALLNLLPILPMDGGRLLETALGPKNSRTTLMISGSVATAAGLFIFMRTGSLIFPIFMGMFAYQSFKALKQPSWR